MLELRAISKRLGACRIADVNLEVRAGEYFVQLGPSGVGKTVLLELIAGLLQPDAGQILWRGRDVTRLPPEARRFAVVYQDYALFPRMKVAGNIGYGLRAAGMKHDRVGESVRSMAELLHIEDLLDRHPETLSGGEAQRVALARALVTRPELLLLDEPLSALDLNTRRELRKLLQTLHQTTGVTILHVTHDMEEALMLGQRIGVMLEGRVLQVGSPEELFRRPTDHQVAEFLGMQNLLPITAAREQICEIGGLKIHAASADEKSAHAWIKPEEILISREPFESSARNQFRARVAGWEPRQSLVLVHLEVEGVRLSALVTYQSFTELELRIGAECLATFKSSAVHCL